MFSKPLGIYFSQASLSLQYLYATPEKTSLSLYNFMVMIRENDALPVNLYVSIISEAVQASFTPIIQGKPLPINNHLGIKFKWKSIQKVPHMRV